MGRKTALFGFWIVGYAIGFFAWLNRASMIKLIESIGLNAEAADALLAGLFGSTVMVIGVLVWSFFSTKQ
jgi:lysylphosphatidylglycerol synthetase-like protein (DUF2156 family)